MTHVVPVCGDGRLDEGEECDDMSSSNEDDCTNDCHIAVCGDGFTRLGTEECDAAGESSTCNSDCTLSRRGDGKLNASAGERCDDGNSDDGDGCPSSALPAYCGDGSVLRGVEQCDRGTAGNVGGYNGCYADCTLPPHCGDGVLQAEHEECDSAWGPACGPACGLAYRLDAGGQHNCGLRTDGSVRCWGSNEYGESSPPARSFVQIDAGDWHTCGITIDGPVVCWGAGQAGGTQYVDHGQSAAPEGTFREISAALVHTCGIRADGSVTCWGRDKRLQGCLWDFFSFDCGQGNPPLGQFVHVASGRSHSCGIR